MVSHEIQSEVGLELQVGLLSGLGVALGYRARVGVKFFWTSAFIAAVILSRKCKNKPARSYSEGFFTCRQKSSICF